MIHYQEWYFVNIPMVAHTKDITKKENYTDMEKWHMQTEPYTVEIGRTVNILGKESS